MPSDKSLLSSPAHLGVCKTTSVQPFDFSTLYTSIPEDSLKSTINNIHHKQCFKTKSLPLSMGHVGVSKKTSIQTFDFFTRYTSIPDDLRNSPINNITSNAFRQSVKQLQFNHSIFLDCTPR